MHAVAISLIYLAVVVRGLVRLGDVQHPGLVVALLVLYGLLLLVESQRNRVSSKKPGFWLSIYLLVQTSLVVGLLLNRAVQDFFALLFIPLSLQAVLVFGRRLGFVCITLFALAMTGPLVASQEGGLFGLVMGLNYSGLCFLIGGYAHQVRVAETARSQNQRTLGELQVAHRQLRDYAAQVEDLAAEQERYRLARELHDSVTQTVFSMNLTVQSARLLLGRDKGRVVDQLVRLDELAGSAMHEIQTLISQLRPRSVADLAAEGLPAALRRLADERRARDGLEVTLEVGGERALPEPVAVGLLGIAQEALTNVAKHAATQQAILRLSLSEGTAFLEVEDGGLGFDPQAACDRRGHLGLAGMAERARELGWKLSVESRPGCGTRVRVEENPPGALA